MDAMICAICGVSASPGNPVIEYRGRRTGSLVLLHRVCWAAKVLDWVGAFRAAIGPRTT